MFLMEIDSSSPEPITVATSEDIIIKRLENLGVPAENLEHRQPGLIVYVKNNKSQVEELVSGLLPSNEEEMNIIIDMQTGCPKSIGNSAIKDLFQESMMWLQWLMFEGEPRRALDHLANTGQRGVCGAIWGDNDIAYRCRTCEHDPTCAICVPCFRNGNHKDHDYSIIYTGGGCCDCGDVTAWKRDGFCSKHKGAEQIQPLPEECANSLCPVLDPLLSCWRKGLLFTESISEQSPKLNNHAVEYKNITDELTSAILEMLLDFCKDSESLLSFISRRIFSSEGLLDVLVRAERFIINGDIVRKLHALLLKMLGEPQFKYEFAKVFLSYYSTVMKEAVKESNDRVFKKCPLLSTFSVQIFTVPTLTPRLVKEMNLLAMLLDCLRDILISCAGENGRLKVNKWGNLYDTTLRVVEDIRFVMSHSAVPRYVTRDRRDILRTWMKLLTFVQGMDPQKRGTGIHVEEEGDNVHLPFVLGHTIANIHSLLVGGAFSVSSTEDADDALFSTHIQDFDEQGSQRHAKVGRLSQESSVSSVAGRSPLEHASRTPESKSDSSPLSSSVLWLTFECLKAIENWLGVDNTSGPLLHVLSPKTGASSGNNFFAPKRIFSKFSRGRQVVGSHSPSDGPSDGIELPSSTEGCNKLYSYSSLNGDVALNSRQNLTQETASFSDSDKSMHQTNYAIELEALRVLSLSDWPDIPYQVSSQDIYVHIPLHRLLSMVLQRALRQCYGETAGDDICSSSSSAIYHDFLGYILGGCHPLGFSAFIMEHALRIKVFCAQVRAGMWRRNGDVAILSCEWYRSVRWSEQGLEVDLFLLQCCAALGPADQYVSRILERFELSDYLSLNLERSNDYEPTIVQEMLTLIIQIVKERRFSGLSPSECLQRELVHKLSTGDATRSQLVKSLPRDFSKIDELQEVLDRIAAYSNPSGMNQGTYKLRTPYWKELDLYHPRWNSKELQVAEERYMQFCNASALTSQLPKWTKIYPPLGGIAKIATCKTVLQIVRAVVFYAVFSDKSNASCAPDDVLLTALHLLYLALDICYMHRGSGDCSCYGDDVIPILALASEELSLSKYGDQSLLSLLVLLMRKYRKENDFVEAGIFDLSSLIGSLLEKFAELQYECKIKLQDLAPDVVNQLAQSVSTGDTNNLEFVPDSDKRKAKARERQAAKMEKMRAQQSEFLKSIDSSAEAGAGDSNLGKERSDPDVRCNYEEATQVICSLCHDPNSKSPLSYLILLQKSRLLTFTNRGPPSWTGTQNFGEEPESCAKRMANISSQRSILSSSQEVISSPWSTQSIQNAINEFALEAQPKEVGAFFEYIRARFPALKIQLPCTSSNVDEDTGFSLEMLEEQIYSLIRERMDVNSWQWDLSRNGKKLSAGGDGGSVESLLLGKYISALAGENLDGPSASESAESIMPLTAYEGFGPSDCDGIYLSSCGHAVHQGCLDRYLSSLKERYTRRIVFEGGHIVDPDQGEFLCPVCRGLANSVLPALPVDYGRFRTLYSTSSPSDAVGPSPLSSGVVDALHFQKALFLLQSAADVTGSREIFQKLPVRQFGQMRINLESLYHVLCGMYSLENDRISESGRLSHSLVLYDTLKYSLVSTEIATRSGKTSLAPNYNLGALYKELQSSNGFILALLLSIVQSTRTKNSLTVLLRLRGIQRFAESICTGTSADEISGPSVEGNMQDILEYAETEDQYPDIQVWRWSADPVLAHDAFSSLMWIIYCLPCPLLSCDDAFLSLVHLFYAVTVTQAIITYWRKRQCSLLELGCDDSLVTDIYKIIGEHGVANEYFDSNFIETSYDIKDAIRSLTFPYLRRCALFWKLIHSSRVVPFNDGTNILDGSTYSTNELMECGENNAAELIQIEKLEKILKIPSLDYVFYDVTIRLVVQKWLHHFYRQFETRGLKGVLYSTPAAPFKLMPLPYLYQDLLQRYIKQNCPDCGAVQKDPAMCLLCGKLCSASWKKCCRESGCQAHAMVCGAATGVFLLIRKTTILLQRSARQAPWPSPYLDIFGEEDNDMQRGKPLYLNEERYAALTHMVASHGLDQSSKVLRHTTIGAFFML